jgi:hypothetical protein
MNDARGASTRNTRINRTTKTPEEDSKNNAPRLIKMSTTSMRFHLSKREAIVSNLKPWPPLWREKVAGYHGMFRRVG